MDNSTKNDVRHALLAPIAHPIHRQRPILPRFFTAPIQGCILIVEDDLAVA
jgi:hypothetical protein